MLPIPEYISVQFNNVLRQRAIPESFHVHSKKWLRYFLDFCEKYPQPETKSEQVRLFIDKLKSKKQTPEQCSQAAHAISLFFESQQVKNFNFADGIFTVHGKGDKDRTIPLPKKLTTKLKTRLEMLRELHDKDLASGYAGVFLPDSLEKKYPDNAGPCRCENNDDLYPLRAKQNCQRSEKSFGFLTIWHG